MENASQSRWTGVQYSVFRVGLAVLVARVCLSRLAIVEGPAWAFFFLGIVGAFLLALGWRDRAVTLNLLLLIGGLGAIADGAPLVFPQADVLLTSLLLFFHLWVPVTPFGSWDARERIDPRGDWFRPEWLGQVAWVALALIHLERAYLLLGNAVRTTAELDFALLSGVTVILEVAFALATFRAAWRPPVWVALTIWQIAWWIAFGFEIGAGALLWLHFFAMVPAWWPGRALHAQAEPNSALPPGQARLFYDGDCGFCHRSVRFILSEEAGTPESLSLRFAPLQGDTFAETMAARTDYTTDDLPDSIILVLEDGTLLTQSAAALEIASRLGGFWRGVALVGRLVPTGLLDRAYDFVAGIRKKIFAQPKDACPILPPDLRARFDG